MDEPILRRFELDPLSIQADHIPKGVRGIAEFPDRPVDADAASADQ
jgi:hypothetical protein